MVRQLHFYSTIKVSYQNITLLLNKPKIWGHDPLAPTYYKTLMTRRDFTLREIFLLFI